MMIDTDQLIEQMASKVAAKLEGRLIANGTAAKKRLLTVEQAAEYLGRTVIAMEHIIGKGGVRVVRIDRRVYLDIKDLDQWIDSSKG